MTSKGNQWRVVEDGGAEERGKFRSAASINESLDDFRYRFFFFPFTPVLFFLLDFFTAFLAAPFFVTAFLEVCFFSATFFALAFFTAFFATFFAAFFDVFFFAVLLPKILSKLSAYFSVAPVRNVVMMFPSNLLELSLSKG